MVPSTLKETLVRTAALAVVTALAPAAVPAQDVCRVILRPGDVVELFLEIPDDKQKLEASKALKGTVLGARVAADFHRLGYTVIREGAAAAVEVVDASAPLKKGVAGFFHLRLTELEFADGRTRELDTGITPIYGEDRSDRPKKLLILSRKGGKAVVFSDESYEIHLVEDPEAAAGEQAGEEQGGAEPSEPPAPREPVVIYLDPAVCGAADG